MDKFSDILPDGLLGLTMDQLCESYEQWKNLIKRVTFGPFFYRPSLTLKGDPSRPAIGIAILVEDSRQDNPKPREAPMIFNNGPACTMTYLPQTRIDFTFPLPHFIAEEPALRCLRMLMERVVLHELYEHLRLDGKLVDDPHKNDVNRAIPIQAPPYKPTDLDDIFSPSKMLDKILADVLKPFKDVSYDSYQFSLRSKK